MRKLGLVLGLLGGFLVMLALLAKFYAPGQLMRTPVDVDSTTRLSGEAAVGSDPSGPVKAISLTRTNSEKSTDDTVVWVSSSCLVKDEGDVPDCVSADDPQKRLINAGIDNFATDRKTALAVNDAKLLPPDAEPHEGLVNKWPFEAEKKTYPYWDGTLGRAVDAEFTEETTVEGVKGYVYEINTVDEPIELTEGVQGLYSSQKRITVEPLTGSILNQEEHQTRVTDDGENFLTLDLAFTPEQLKKGAEDTEANVSSLNLIRSTVPLIGFLAGIPLLIIGVVLSLRGRNEANA